MKRLVTISEYAREKGIARITVYRQVKEGKLEIFYRGKQPLIPMEDDNTPSEPSE